MPHGPDIVCLCLGLQLNYYSKHSDPHTCIGSILFYIHVHAISEWLCTCTMYVYTHVSMSAILDCFVDNNYLDLCIAMIKSITKCVHVCMHTFAPHVQRKHVYCYIIKAKESSHEPLTKLLLMDIPYAGR